jgi:hypothetical protein
MKEVKITTIRGLEAKALEAILDEEGTVIYKQRDEFGQIVLDVFTETKDEKNLIHKLNKGYEQYKQEHPDIEERQFTKKKKTHCGDYGEWLPFGSDICSECGRRAK